MPLSSKALAPATRKAREEVKSSIWLTIGVSTDLAGAEQVDGLRREILGAVGGGQDQGAAAVGDEAAHQQAERVGDHPRAQDVLDGDRVAEGGARVFRRPFALHDRHHRQLLLGDAVGLHVAQDRDREEGRRPHRPVGQFELAGEAARRHRRARARDAGAAAFAVGDQDRLAQPAFERRRGVADVDHERAAADRGAVDPFGGDAEIMRDRHRRLAGGRDAVDVLRARGRNPSSR